MKEVNGRQTGSTPIEGILGRRVFKSTYFTNSLDEYMDSLKRMNVMDLHKHSLEVLGEMTRGDRERIVLKLKSAFIKTSQQGKIQNSVSEANVTKDKKNTLKDLLNRGV